MFLVLKSLNFGVNNLGFKLLYVKTMEKPFNPSDFPHLKNQDINAFPGESLRGLNEVIYMGTFCSFWWSRSNQTLERRKPFFKFSFDHYSS